MKLVSPSDPILLGTAKPVSFPDPSLPRIFSAMMLLMIQHDGCGLAAPQVGLPMRLFTYRTATDIGIAINPVILEQSKETKESIEGCLTFPGQYWKVTRSSQVLVQYHDLAGVSRTRWVDGLMAAICQHETEHLDGILISQHGQPHVH
jgi:peptide deformylase